ncbi:MAG: hypothetical protein ABI068_11650 [Ktedonobacterales bacterium]
MTNPDGPDRLARPDIRGAHNGVNGATSDKQGNTDILSDLPTARVAITSAPPLPAATHPPDRPPSTMPGTMPGTMPMNAGDLFVDLPTARIAVASMPLSPSAPAANGAPAPSIADLPTGRLSMPSIADLPTGRLAAPTAPPLPQPVQPLPPAHMPAPVPTPPRKGRRKESEHATRAAYSEATTTKLPTPQSPRPRRRGSLGWRIVNTALLVLLLLALGGVGALYLYGKAQAARPQQVANAFCVALTGASYSPAYDLLSPTMQQQFSRQMFQTDETLRDQLDGHVTRCTAQQQGKTPQFGYMQRPNVVRFQVTLTRHSSVTGLIALVPVGTDWRIGAIQSSLQGTDLAPLDLVGRLCQAFTAGDAAHVYTYFTPAFQHEQGATKVFTSAFGQGLRITQCIPALHTYQLASNNLSATMQITLIVKATVAHTGGIAQTFPATAQVVCLRSANGWLVDNLALQH